MTKRFGTPLNSLMPAAVAESEGESFGVSVHLYLAELDVTAQIERRFSSGHAKEETHALWQHCARMMRSAADGQEQLLFFVPRMPQDLSPEGAAFVQRMLSYKDGVIKFMKERKGYIVVLPRFSDFSASGARDYYEWVRLLTDKELHLLVRRGGA